MSFVQHRYRCAKEVIFRHRSRVGGRVREQLWCGLSTGLGDCLGPIDLKCLFLVQWLGDADSPSLSQRSHNDSNVYSRVKGWVTDADSCTSRCKAMTALARAAHQHIAKLTLFPQMVPPKGTRVLNFTCVQSISKVVGRHLRRIWNIMDIRRPKDHNRWSRPPFWGLSTFVEILRPSLHCYVAPFWRSFIRLMAIFSVLCERPSSLQIRRHSLTFSSAPAESPFIPFIWAML
jgi:hypothetical protein